MKKGTLVGLHVYTDERGRYVFYNIFDKKGYWINDDDEYKKYTIYQSRLPLAIIIGFIVTSVLNRFWLGIGLGIFIYVGMTFMFYKNFVPSLKVISGFKKPENSSLITRIVEPLSQARIITASILCLAMSILLCVNVQMSDFDELTAILNYALSAIVLVFSIIFLVAFYRKRKMEGK